MIEIKTLSKDDLKRDYTGRHGFVFESGSPCDLKKIDTIGNALIKGKITESLPEFVTQIQPNMLVFVYGEGISFKSGEFFQKANGIGSAMGAWRIDTLMGYLYSN